MKARFTYEEAKEYLLSVVAKYDNLSESIDKEESEKYALDLVIEPLREQKKKLLELAFCDFDIDYSFIFIVPTFKRNKSVEESKMVFDAVAIINHHYYKNKE